MSLENALESLFPDLYSKLSNIEKSLAVAAMAGAIGCSNPNAPNEIDFASRNVQPPSQFYLTHGMQIRVRGVTSQTNEILSMTALMLIDNRLVPIQASSDPFTNSTAAFNKRIDTSGFLVSCSLSCAVASVRCESYAVVEVLDQTGTFLYSLFAGYLTVSKPIAYPPIQIEDAISGIGKTVYGSHAVIAGATQSIVIPANRAWKLLEASCQVTTDATVYNRSIFLGTPNGVTRYYATVTQPASLTFSYWCGTVLTFPLTATDIPLNFTSTIAIPGIAPFGRWIFFLDKAPASLDTFINNISFSVEEWLTL